MENSLTGSPLLKNLNQDEEKMVKHALKVMLRYVPLGVVLAATVSMILMFAYKNITLEEGQWIVFAFLFGIIIVPAIIHGVLGRPFKRSK